MRILKYATNENIFASVRYIMGNPISENGYFARKRNRKNVSVFIVFSVSYGRRYILQALINKVRIY